MPFDTTPLPRDPVVALLRRARNRVATGWCQNALYNEQGEFCAIGALRCESVNRQSYTPTTAASETLLARCIRRHGFVADDRWGKWSASKDDAWVIVSWNNAEGRIQTEVVAAFNSALELAEREALTREIADAV